VLATGRDIRCSIATIGWAAGLASAASTGHLLIFRERLMRLQVGGAVLILAGLVLLGFGS